MKIYNHFVLLKDNIVVDKAKNALWVSIGDKVVPHPLRVMDVKGYQLIQDIDIICKVDDELIAVRKREKAV